MFGKKLMKIYAAEYSYVDDASSLDETRPQHRAFLRELFEAGSLLASGPLLDEAPGALLVLRASDRDGVAAMLAEDPFAHAKLITSTTIRQWNPVIGPWDS